VAISLITSSEVVKQSICAAFPFKSTLFSGIYWSLRSPRAVIIYLGLVKKFSFSVASIYKDVGQQEPAEIHCPTDGNFGVSLKAVTPSV